MNEFSPITTNRLGFWKLRALSALVGVSALLLSPYGGSAELTIADGVVVKFADQGQLVIRDRLATGSGVVFTSRKDASVGGVTDDAGVAAAGDWRGVRVEKSALSTSALNDLTIRYAGAEGAAGLVLRSYSQALKGLQISDSLVGLSLLQGASPAISASSFFRNGIGVQAADSSHPSITASNFVQNTQFALSNQTPSAVITATGNWWGHASGPQDSAGNPAGQGDAVSTGVNYGNFLTTVPLTNPSIRVAAPATYYDGNSIAFELSCGNATEFRLSENANFSGVSFQPLTGGRASTNYTFSSGDGRKAIAVEFRSISGATVVKILEGGVLLDTQVPSLTVRNPSAGSIVSGLISVEADAVDASGISRVEFYVDDVLKRSATATPYKYDWNTDASAEGIYTLRTVAVDLAGRSVAEQRQVEVYRAPPPPDVAGPALSNIRLDNLAFTSGTTITKSGTIAVDSSDRSGIARIELLLDGVVVTSFTGASLFSASFDITNVANGAHVLLIRATDSLNNVTPASFDITVAHAAPDAPKVSSPVTGKVVRDEALTVTGTSIAGAQVQLFINGVAAGEVISAAADGRFTTVIALAEGSNQLQAQASTVHGTSTLSAAVLVTRDSSIPLAPSNVLAASQASGKIHLTWTRSTDPKAVAYEIYRSSAPFATTSEAFKVNQSTLAATATAYDDLPATDGSYYYRLISKNAVGTPSIPTNQVQGIADKTPPKIITLAYAPQGKVDVATGRVGQGRVNVTATLNESLSIPPYLSIVPAGSPPMPVELARISDTEYQGYFTITQITGSGVAHALFSARDLVGNRGTDIDAGATLTIDTEGPALSGIALTPAAPIKNDSAQTLTVTFGLSKSLKSGDVPQLQWLLSGPLRSPQAVSAVTRVNETTWTGTVALPTDAGLAGPEALSFSYQGQDDLDNVSTRITALNQFQVYQGNLPPFAVPFGLAAKAQPGGKVALSWQAVEGVAAYQLYREDPNGSTLEPLLRVTEPGHVDQTTVDGSYRYTVASVRQSNDQEALSNQSEAVEVHASSTAPGAPQNLQLTLTGQGIYAAWQPPLASTVSSYNLYRANSSTITEVTGLTPLRKGITQTITIDPNPSVTEHAYVVTALDAAGNESVVSNSVYLNASLLPVASLKVEKTESGLPVLSWAASRTSVAGYHVYVGEGESKTRLTANPITALSFTDNGYTSGARYYTVAAVDAHGVEMPRSLLMPPLEAQVVAGLPLKRGVMNRLQLQVVNTSDVTVTNAQVRVNVGNRNHPSEVFSLGANQTRLVPVVVGGYADLPAQAVAEVTVEIVPNEGELVRLVRQTTMEVNDSALVVGVATEAFTRGGTGQVRLTIENTSDVDVELLTARNSGSQVSDELRFKLLDADGNVLAVQPYKQVLGVGVITLTNGLTVARIPAGAAFTSDLFALNVPTSSPDRIRVRLEVDKLRYHSGQPDEVTIGGLGSEVAVSLADTAYTAEVTTVAPVNSYGDENVVISGKAFDRSLLAGIPSARVKLLLNQQGFERSVDLVTDAAGQFTYTFTPGYADAGLYKVAAVHPDITDRPEQKAFTINRVTVGPTPYKLTVPRNYRYSVPFTVKAGAGTAATNVRLELEGSLPSGIRLELPAPVSITPRQQLNIPMAFTADNTVPVSGSLIFNVFSDEHATSPLGKVKVDYLLSEAKPYLTASPSFVETGLAMGSSTVESVLIENKGLQSALDLNFALVKADGSPAPAWVTLINNSNGTLAVGEKRTLDLAFTPPEGTPEGVYEFKLNVRGTNIPDQALNVFASVTQSGIGNMLFKAADIYTATVDKNGQLIPGLKGARIVVQNEDVVSVTHELLTDALGEAFFQDLPSGYYKFKATAANHQELNGRFQIKPGITQNQPVFLDYNLVTVEWSVREITIQDRYEITLNATFETDVPAPVVVMQPGITNLPPMKPGDVYYGELVLTNYGLVRADNVKSRFPTSDAYFKYEFLAEVPSTLEAKARITIPYRIVSLASLEGNGAATGGGCYSYSSSAGVSYSYDCANGSTSTGSAGGGWSSGSSSTCGGGTTSTTSGGGGWTGSGGGGLGGGGGSYSELPGQQACPVCPPGGCDGGGGSGQ